MNGLVVDTSIVFSVLLGGRVKDVFSMAIMETVVHAPLELVEEIREHIDRIIEYSNLSPGLILDLVDEILGGELVLHGMDSLPRPVVEKAVDLASRVDPDDWPFIALAMHLGMPLWTGDKKVIRLAVETGFRFFKAVDTRGVEMFLEGKNWDEVRDYLAGRYGGEL